MTRTLTVVAALLSLSLPAALAAPPEGKGKPDEPGKSAAAPGQSAEKNAAKKTCKAERAAMSAAAYHAKYKSNGLGKCIAAQKQTAQKGKAKTEDEEAEQTQAEENAAKKCKAERDELGLARFKEKYAPPGHPNGANAYGKCVSKLSKKATTD